jgi:hypothetical protein
MPYYYACSYPLAAGSIIETGNWGRMCRLENIETKSGHLLMELVFENIRLQKFSGRPSRFSCNFLCPNPLSIQNFVATNKRLFDLMYEVELIDKNAKTFETDWTLVSSAHPNINALEHVAHRYWDPHDVDDKAREVLTDSAIRIIRRL